MYIDYNLIENNLNNKSVLNKILLTYEVSALANTLRNTFFDNYSIQDIKDKIISEYKLDIDLSL